jgi:hypothetical protein
MLARPEAFMSRARQGLSGLAVLLAAAACGDNATSPTPDPRPQIPPFSSATPAVAVLGDCTFGAGYWKAQTSAWPARFDPGATFYTSGKSWIDVLSTPPEGDVYYILARQFIAAALNLDRLDPGLRPTEIGEPFAILDQGYFTDGGHSSLTRSELLSLAILFESFNEGDQGVRPCS